MSIMRKGYLPEIFIVKTLYNWVGEYEKVLGLYLRYNDIELAGDRLIYLLDVETQCFPGWILCSANIKLNNALQNFP